MKWHEYKLTAQEVHIKMELALALLKRYIGTGNGVDTILDVMCEVEAIRNAARYNVIVNQPGKEFGERVDNVGTIS